MINYCKLRDGTWGLKGPSLDLHPGETVHVQKKDGTQTTEVVGRMIWAKDGMAIASIRKPEGTCCRCMSSTSEKCDDCGTWLHHDCSNSTRKPFLCEVCGGRP